VLLVHLAVDALEFVGYTPPLVAGIWIGFGRPAAIAGEATAGRIAEPARGHLMQQVERQRPSSAEWQVPDGRVTGAAAQRPKSLLRRRWYDTLGCPPSM
jgi:membrane carboxypeptidase/penicillin-binding protein